MIGWRLNLLCFGAISFWKRLSRLIQGASLGMSQNALFLLNMGSMAGKGWQRDIQERERCSLMLCQAL